MSAAAPAGAERRDAWSSPSLRAALFAAIVLLAGLLQWRGLLDVPDGKAFDAATQGLRALAPQPVRRDVTVIGIDVDDLRAFPDPRDFWHPQYGRLLAALAKAPPAVVGLDIVFPERSYQHLIPGLDQALMQGLLALRPAAPVVLARTVDDMNNFREIFAPYLAVAGPESVGSVIVCRDEDEVVRRFDEFFCDDTRREALISLAGQMARRLDVQGEWRGWINFRVGEPFPYLPFRQVLEWAEKGDPRFAQAVQGKPVLVGFVLPFEDRKKVPADLAAWEPGNRSVPGVLVHAQVLRSMLNGGLVQRVPGWGVLALVVAGAAFVYGASRSRKTLLFLAFLAALAAGAVLGLAAGWMLPVAAAALAAVLAFGTRFVTDAVAQARERATLREAFGGYVSPQIMKEILDGNLRPSLGGKRRRVCLLFSDIRNFTTRSETMEPEALIELTNRYFTEMTQAIHEHGGTVDKFIGDGIMCFFGAPQPLEKPSEPAFAAAKEMLRRLDRFNEQLAAQGLPPIRIGIGLNVGDAVVGHVGSETRHEYTAMGDTVNTASRIEGLTKTAGYPLLVSRAVWEELSDRGGLVEVGEMAIKGRSAVFVYGWKP